MLLVDELRERKGSGLRGATERGRGKVRAPPVSVHADYFRYYSMRVSGPQLGGYLHLVGSGQGCCQIACNAQTGPTEHPPPRCQWC